MKKLISILLVLLLTFSLFAQGAKEGSGVTASPFAEPINVNVVAMKGPTAMGMVELMERASNGVVGNNNYGFTLEAAPDAVVPQIVKGDVDIAAIPANLAAVVYNNTNTVKVLGINTLGVLYLCGYGDAQLTSLEDLRGKTIYSSGRGATPQYAVDTLLANSGLEVGKDVFIEWKSEHAEVVAALVAAKGDAYGVLPQPFATTAVMQNSDISILYDLNDAWEALTGVELVTGVVVARKDFIVENRAAVEQFLRDYRSSVEFVNSAPKAASELVEKFGIIKANVAERAIPYCNITLITGEELKNTLSVYLEALYEQNPQSVGGKVPGEDFYY